MLKVVLLLLIPFVNYGQAPNLGTAANFVLFTTVGAVTNTGTSHLTGNVGSNSGSSTGFGNVNGQMHDGDGVSGTCAADLLIAYHMLDTTTPTAFPSPLLGNGDTLRAGVYKTTAVTTLNLNLILDAQGNPNAVFIFQIQAAFSVNAGAKVVLINGAKACNVFWKGEGLISVGAGATMRGTIIANNAAIALGASDTLEGRALSTTGAVTLNGIYAYTPIGCGSPVLTGPAAPSMGAIKCYALFSGNGAVSNSGTTYVTGDIGTNVGLTTGFNPLFVTGFIHPIPDVSTAAAAASLGTVYTYLNSLAYDIELLYPAQFGNNLVLTPHTYLLNAATTLTDTLYLDAQNDSNAVFVIKINGALITTSYCKIKYINGAKSNNVYWKIEGAATIADHSTFSGTIVVNNAALLFNTGVTLTGRALTTNGALTTVAVTVNASVLPDVGSITGPSFVCIGTPVTFSNVDTGGVWTSSNSRATIGSLSGIVTGVTTGLDTIKYTLTNVCGSAIVTKTINISQAASIIAGPSSVCKGSTITLNDTVTGGTWVSSNTSRATIGSVSGIVTGVSAGSSIITYTLSSGCNALKTITVNGSPSIIAGASALCAGTTTILSDTVTGGTWASSNTLVATIGSLSGVVSGLSAGTITITYALATGCIATKALTVNLSPSVITGSGTVCTGSTTTFTDSIAGGVWSSSNLAIATIGSISGIINGVAAGTSMITYTLPGGCFATKSVLVNIAPSIITGASVVCVGSTTTLLDGVTGGNWTSSNTLAATVGSLSGIVTGVASGTTQITYMLSAGCFAVKTLTINPLPNAGTIAGLSSLCVSATITLSDVALGGIWSSTNTAIATIGSVTGIVTGVASGTSIISYTVTNSCGTAVATSIVTVNPLPNAGIITGLSAVCVGSTITMTDAISGGTWSMNNANASIGSTGIVTGVSAGIDTVKYSVTNVCGTAATTKTITINPLPNAGTIAGLSSLCVSATITLSDVALGGIWSSTNTAIATIGSVSGIVSGVAAGTTIISYTVINSCGTAVATKLVIVNPLPNAGTITGLSTVCVGATITMTDAITGGTWSMSNANASIGSTAIVTGITAGIDTVRYSVTNVCGTTSTTKTITINPLPNAGTITGTSAVCVGLTTTLTSSVGGGTWSSSNANASVGTTGIVTGVTTGTSIISYTVANSCGTASATRMVTITTTAVAGTLSGPSAVCVGAVISLSSTVTGGTWISSNVAIATIGSTSGIVSGIATGSAVMTYTITSGCGTATSMATVAVNPLPNAGTITGAASVCVGSTITITDAIVGGVWSMSNTNASIGSTGIVTGVTAGIDTILYSVTNICGTATATKTISINPLPNAGAISGASSLCALATITLSNVVLGGVWSSSNTASATIGSASGIVNGVATGTTIISYTVSNSCGTAVTTKLVTVNPLPNAGTITGLSTVCVGSTLILTDAIAGGIWSMSNVNASIGSTGIVTGVTAGIDTVMYSVTNLCGTTSTTKTITINPLPNAGTITGTSAVCVGLTTTLTSSVGGGTWSSSNANASVGTTGIVTGVTTGTAMISYTVANSCGTASATRMVTITTTAIAGTISGPSSVCEGAVITLSSSVTGGTWVSSNASIASVGSLSGIVSGIATGSAVMTYTITSGCGTATSMATVNVNPLPNAGTITGAASLCVGATTTMTDAITGGIWSMSNANSTIGTTGVVNGLATGMDTIMYSVTNGCGTATASKTIMINALPNAGSISGSSAVCLGLSIILTDLVSGGNWSSSNVNASVGSTGVVTGLIAGTSLISYTVSNSCGTISATKMITITTTAIAGTISGPANVCEGAVITLTSTVTGGTWMSSDPATATVGSASGIVSGILSGSAIITYTITSGCGTASTNTTITVNPLPNAGTISGPGSVCVGSSISLTDVALGGTWSVSNTNVTIGSTGIVTGVVAGTDTVLYTATNGCGTAVANAIVTINPLPDAGVISGSSAVCIGSSIILTDVIVGGVWSSSNTNASVGTTGVVTGLASGTSIVSYTVANSCGTISATMIINITTTAVAGTISGLSAVCEGSNIMLTSTVSGGTWISSNPSIASIGTTSGIISGITPGIALITYTVTSGCGTAITVTTITVNPLPDAGSISGAGSVCVGATILLTNSISVGTWSSTNTNATVFGGLVTGLISGIDTILFTVINSCGTRSVSKIIIINPLPVAGSILGLSSVCVGASITLTPTITGGTWSATNSTASVVGGVVTGLIAGNDTIVYSITNACGTDIANKVIAINALADAGTLSGPSKVCVGATITLTTSVGGGTWTAQNATATVSGGIVTGVTAGNNLISYSVSGVCGNVSVTQSVTVNALPAAPAITTQCYPTVCKGTMYQNFGTSSVPPVGITYAWSANNAFIWAEGIYHQYSLVNFNTIGNTLVNLTATSISTGCSNKSSTPITVSAEIAQIDVVTYFNNHFVCTPNNEGSYQWGYDNVSTLDSTIMRGEINEDYVNTNPDFNNKYYWVMTTNGTCLQKTYYTVPLGVQEVRVDDVSLSVYPNPATTLINVVLSSSDKSQVEVNIWNMVGQMVNKDVTIANRATLDISSLAAGSYMVVCTRNGINIAHSRLIKN